MAGGRLSDEDAYALSKLTRTAFGTNDVDHRPWASDPSAIRVEQAQTRGMPVTYSDIEEAKVILLIGLDAEQELPILHLRIRKAARRGARVFVIHPRRTRLWDVAEHILCRPGEEAIVSDELRSTLSQAGPEAMVLMGPRLLQSPSAIELLPTLVAGWGGKFSLLCRRANDRGALRAGLHPALLPGGRPISGEDDRTPTGWGNVPAEPGRNTAEILAAAAAREIDVLFLVGTDPLRDFPDAALA